jgi:hypothetical protein
MGYTTHFFPLARRLGATITARSPSQATRSAMDPGASGSARERGPMASSSVAEIVSTMPSHFLVDGELEAIGLFDCKSAPCEDAALSTRLRATTNRPCPRNNGRLEQFCRQSPRTREGSPKRQFPQPLVGRTLGSGSLGCSLTVRTAQRLGAQSMGTWLGLVFSDALRSSPVRYRRRHPSVECEDMVSGSVGRVHFGHSA